jgi:hypothetical protein
MGVMKRIATTRIWNPDFTGKLYDPELAAMARVCRKGAEKPDPLPPGSMKGRGKGSDGNLLESPGVVGGAP